MLGELDWDHLRLFLAVMRAPSLRQAAQTVGVSHPTVRRRLQSLEDALGIRLFDRRTDGIHATPEATELIELAEQIEASVVALGRRANNADPELRGRIRLTAPSPLVTDLLMPSLATVWQRWPQIDLQVDTSYEVADLALHEADIALRAVAHGETPDDDLVGRRAATSFHAVYGEGEQWVGWWGDERDRQWVATTPFPDAPIRGKFNSPSLQRAAAQAGMGLTRLPCFFADPYLRRRCAPQPKFDIWVVVHPDLRTSPRLRTVRDEIVAELGRLQPRLDGSAATTSAPR